MGWRLLPPFAALAVLSLLLVFGSDRILPGRAFQTFWNLGHVAYFALITWLLLHWPWLRRQRYWLRWLLPLAVSLVVGGVIELMQIGTERTADPWDVLRNVSGSLLVLLLVPVLPPGHRAWRWTLRLSALILLLWLLMPLARVLYDDAWARWQFPVLADFSAPFELDRWQGNANVGLTRLPGQDQPLLAITLKPGVAYPGVSLKHFPGDWRGYRQLHIRLYQPGPEPLSLTLRIHDRAHETGPNAYEYSDRFNRSFVLQPGWSDLAIPLDDVRNAPVGRPMELSQIVDVGLFAVAVNRPRNVFLERLALRQ